MDDVDVLAAEQLLGVLVAWNAEGLGEGLQLLQVGARHGDQFGTIVVTKCPRETIRRIPVTQPEDRYPPSHN
jgi:hypothetical protein